MKNDERGELPGDRAEPHPDHLAPDHPCYTEIMERHRAAIATGRPLYEDPTTGLWVMTAATLWERACCENGCRHCPHVPRLDRS